MEEITEKSKVSLDIKAIIGAVVGIVSIGRCLVYIDWPITIRCN